MSTQIERKKIKDSIIVSQHCQRNWDLEKKIPQEDIDVILASVTDCPSKQNIAFYNVHAITDRATIEAIHEKTYGKSASGKTKADSIGLSNPQTLANLLLVFTERSYKDQVINVPEENRNAELRELASAMESGADISKQRRALDRDGTIALGIAAGYCNLTASMLGYRTGCASCFDEKAVKDILNSDEKPLLLMGVGINKEGTNRRSHHQDNSFLFRTLKKEPIKVTKID